MPLTYSGRVSNKVTFEAQWRKEKGRRKKRDDDSQTADLGNDRPGLFTVSTAVLRTSRSPAIRNFHRGRRGTAYRHRRRCRGWNSTIRYPLRVATDSQGNAYFTSDNYVFKLDQNGIATRIAGSPQAGYSGDGGPATSAQFSSPDGVAVDQAGNLFVVDYGNHRVRKISPSGIIITVAGDGTPSFSGDGGPAVSARMLRAERRGCGRAGNLIIADSGNRRIRKVPPAES